MSNQSGTPSSEQPDAVPATAPAGHDPFTVVQPRRRWIAPERRAAVIVISAVSAILLLGIGALGGAWAAHRHDTRFGPGFGSAGVHMRMDGGYRGPGVGEPGQPRFPQGPMVRPPASPTTTS